jgi:DNA-directed RNA polymerase specialized sigma24 family protein
MNDTEFQDFLHHLRQGDPVAFESLVNRCGPHTRRLIRGWLTGSDLRRLLDSSDIWQEILIKFDRCVRSGQAHPQNFTEMENYLRSMAYHKFIDLLRKEQRGGPRPKENGQELDLELVPDGSSRPSEVVALDDLRERFISLLSPEATWIFGRLVQGSTWGQIGAELDQAPSTVRIRFAREVQRTVKVLQAE